MKRKNLLITLILIMCCKFMDAQYPGYYNKTIIRIHDSVFTVKNGVLFFVFKDSVGSTDTTHLSDRINLKLNIADTGGHWANSIYRKTGSDSVFYFKGGHPVFGFRDSIGFTDTSNLSFRIGLKYNTSDTGGHWLNSVYRKTGTDSIFLYKGGLSVYAYKDSLGKTDTASLSDRIGTRYTLTSDYTTTSASYKSITGLSASLTSTTRYWFRIFIYYETTNASRGAGFSVYSSGIITYLAYRSEYSLTTTSKTINEGLTAFDLPLSSNATCAGTSGNIAIIEGVVELTGSSTDLQARVIGNTAGATITVKSKSFIEIKKL